MKLRMALGSALAVGQLLAFVASVHAAPGEGCVPGTYLVQEGSGTQSLWSFSADGTLHITSSAQGALKFGDAYGAWKTASDKQVKSTVLDFNYSSSSTNGGFPPTSIARVDATASFSKHCADMQGAFELRFFDPQTEDPLNPNSDTGEPISDTFTGRRVNPE